MSIRTSLLSLALCVSFTSPQSGIAAPADAPIKLPTWSQQIAMREGWLVKRHALILDMMRRHNIDMWVIVNEEFHNDPLTEYVAPPRPYTGNRDIFIFIDTGSGLRKVAVTGYAEENVNRFFEQQEDPKPADQQLSALYAQYHPKHIGLSIDAKRGAQRSLTHDSYQFLAKSMGGDAESHFVSAADLIEEYWTHGCLRSSSRTSCSSGLPIRLRSARFLTRSFIPARRPWEMFAAGFMMPCGRLASERGSSRIFACSVRELRMRLRAVFSALLLRAW